MKKIRFRSMAAWPVIAALMAASPVSAQTVQSPAGYSTYFQESAASDAMQESPANNKFMENPEWGGGCDGRDSGGCFDECCCRRSRFKLQEFNIYPTFSYLDDLVGNYCEFEFATHLDLGRWEMENRTVLNVADLPDQIRLGPANPDPLSGTIGIRANGFGDILSGFFFSRKRNRENGNGEAAHLGVGPVLTFPTANNEFLGSSQFTIGPGVHFSTERGRLTTGFFLWQSWGITDDPNLKKVNQLFGKPFIIYELSEHWHFVSIPLGMSHSWDAPSGDDWTIPIGGGLRRLVPLRDERKMGLQMQAFDYVARKPKDPEWELRFTIEFLFD